MTENSIELGTRQSISRESINMGINIDRSESTRRISITSEPIQHITAEVNINYFIFFTSANNSAQNQSIFGVLS